MLQQQPASPPPGKYFTHIKEKMEHLFQRLSAEKIPDRTSSRIHQPLFHPAPSEASLVPARVTIQIQFSVDISNVAHTLENVFAHVRARPSSFKAETPPVGLITLTPALRQGAINHILALG